MAIDLVAGSAISRIRAGDDDFGADRATRRIDSPFTVDGPAREAV